MYLDSKFQACLKFYLTADVCTNLTLTRDVILGSCCVVFIITISHLTQDEEDEGGVLTDAAPADDSLNPAAQAAPAAELSVSDAEVGHQHSAKMFCVRNLLVVLVTIDQKGFKNLFYTLTEDCF